VLNNLIGTRSGGTVRNQNVGPGVLIQNQASANTIGAAKAGNVISGNGGDGVTITGAGTTGNNIFANSIGVTSLGGSEANLGNGVLIQGASGNNIGGVFHDDPALDMTLATTGNTISENSGAGVLVIGPGANGNAILNNVITDNLRGVIVLQQGANNGISPPLFTVLEGLQGGGSLSDAAQVQGPPGTYLLYFYSTATRDASTLQGEPTHYLGSVPLAFREGSTFGDLSLPGPAQGDKYILMTVTDSSGNTSEFSFASINGAHVDQGMHLGNAPGSSLKVNPAITVGKTLTVTDILKINQQQSQSLAGVHAEKKGKSSGAKGTKGKAEPTGTVYFKDGNTVLAAVKVKVVRGTAQAQAKLKLTTLGPQTIYAVYQPDAQAMQNGFAATFTSSMVTVEPSTEKGGKGKPKLTAFTSGPAIVPGGPRALGHGRAGHRVESGTAHRP
jgi:hypothetical protein